MLKAFLFDMDGVLYDSMKFHAEAWYQTMCQHYGFVCDRKLFYLYEGSTGAQTIDTLFVEQRGRHATAEEIEEMYGEKSRRFTELGIAAPMPGAGDVLRQVAERGLTRVLVTGSSQPTLIERLATTYPGAFDAEHIVWGKDCPIGHGKPHPDPYLMGLNKAGNLSPDEAIVVENAPMGVQAGKAAGIFTVAVNTGPLDASVLLDAGADIVLSGMQELSDRMDEIISLYHSSRG